MALDSYTTALTISQAQLYQGGFDLARYTQANAYYSIGNVYFALAQETDDIEDSQQSFEQAEENYQKFLSRYGEEQSIPELQRATAYYKVGYVYEQRGGLFDSEEDFIHSIENYTDCTQVVENEKDLGSIEIANLCTTSKTRVQQHIASFKKVRGVKVAYLCTGRVQTDSQAAYALMRTAPYTIAKTTDPIKNGETVQIIREEDEWYELRIIVSNDPSLQGHEGWIERWLVDDEGVPACPKATPVPTVSTVRTTAPGPTPEPTMPMPVPVMPTPVPVMPMPVPVMPTPVPPTMSPTFPPLIITPPL